LRKARPELRSPDKSGEEGSFGLVCYLDGAAGTGEERITEGEDIGIGGGATAGVETGPVISSVSWCNWVVRPTRVVLIVCSEVFWHSVSS